MPNEDNLTFLYEARARATSVIAQNVDSFGIRAARDAYPEIWARDAVITGLGAVAVGNSTGRSALEKSLDSLASCQSKLGRIPNHVSRSPNSSELVADTVFAGAIDPTLWFIIAHYVLGTREVSWDVLRNAYCWLEYQDANECGLLEAHESMDWADLFANRYNSLLPNVLWYAANRAMAIMAESYGADGSAYSSAAQDVSFKINQLLWVGPEVKRDLDWVRAKRKEWEYTIRLAELKLAQRPYYLPYVAFRDFGDRCDTLGNLLAILFGVASSRQTDRILEYIRDVALDEPWPLKACWPPVTQADKDWREYYRLYNLNQPHQYHNGGAWPFIGGFYVAALVKAGRVTEAKEMLVRLTRMNHAQRTSGPWDFNEWFHGLSGRPMGHSRQSWSAGMYLYAWESVSRGVVPFFTAEDGW